jgi:hypothetical protein
MALYPATFRTIIGFQPVNHTGYLSMRHQAFRPQMGISYFGNDNIEDSSSIPEATVGTAANLVLPLVGGAMLMDATGEGDISFDLIPTAPMELDLTGSGDFDATAALAVSMAVAMTGSGTLTATIVGHLNASVSLTGTGSLAASMTGLGNMVASLLGSGDLDATIAAYGNMEIDIVVTGTGLTTANVGDAVWDTLLEAGFDAGRILRIIAAATAGKVSGGPAAPAFRNLSDTQDQITGTANSSGDRTSATYGA